MGLKSRIVDRGKQLVQSPRVMRWVSDDRVMKAAEGVLDARTRVKLAWHMLKNGHGLPSVDPALDDSLGETIGDGSPNGSVSRNGFSNGANGHGLNGGSNGHDGAHANGTAGHNGTSNGSVSHGSVSNGSVNGNGARVSAVARPARDYSANGLDVGVNSGMEDALRE